MLQVGEDRRAERIEERTLLGYLRSSLKLEGWVDLILADEPLFKDFFDSRTSDQFASFAIARSDQLELNLEVLLSCK